MSGCAQATEKAESQSMFVGSVRRTVPVFALSFVRITVTVFASSGNIYSVVNVSSKLLLNIVEYCGQHDKKETRQAKELQVKFDVTLNLVFLSIL